MPVVFTTLNETEIGLIRTEWDVEIVTEVMKDDMPGYYVTAEDRKANADPDEPNPDTQVKVYLDLELTDLLKLTFPYEIHSDPTIKLPVLENNTFDYYIAIPMNLLMNNDNGIDTLNDYVDEFVARGILADISYEVVYYDPKAEVMHVHVQAEVEHAYLLSYDSENESAE